MSAAIIFDMDGVLIDSGDAIFKSFRLLLKEYGVDMSAESLGESMGLSMRDQMKIWKEKYPSIPRDLDAAEFSLKSFKYEVEVLREDLKPNKVLLELIDKAKSKGLRVAVATSSTKKRAETLLEMMDIRKRLNVLVTSEDVINHKPNPDIFLEAAKRMNVNPEKCIVIEGAVNGIEAAKRAGMTAVAKVTPYYTKEELAGADHIFSSFNDPNLSSWIVGR